MILQSRISDASNADKQATNPTEVRNLSPH